MWVEGMRDVSRVELDFRGQGLQMERTMASSKIKLAVDSAGRSIKADGRALLRGIDFVVYQTNRELRDGGESIIAGDAERIKGSDAAGRYKGVMRSLKLDFEDSKHRHWDMAHGYLELRVYDDFFAVRTRCDVEATLESEGHFRVEIGELPGLKSLMATFLYSDWWTRTHFDTNLSTLPARTQMLLWQTEDGTYGCIVPLVHGGCKCQLNGRTGQLGADLLFYDGGHAKSEAFAFVGAFGDDPYELVRRCVTRGMQITGRPGKLRWEKPYPEMFEKVGWCTWNAMYAQVNEKGILKKMEHAKAGGFPFGYVLIDDGWSPVTDGQLTSFGTDDIKFPRGLAPLVDDLKGEYGIEHVGVWHTFTGYWRGIHPDADICKENKRFILDSKRDTRIPYPEAARSFGFWNEWHSRLKNQGIDFVKVDNQGATYHHTRGSMPIGDAAKGQQYGLQASIGLNFNQNVINCMCMASECAWHWIASNVSRNSDDFWPGSIESGCEHARQNVYNALWYSNFCWPDWDMWWTHHDLAKYHGAMRAISGGPVYVADEVDKGDYDMLRPLVLSDGTILRCDEPALPTRDCLFADPKNNPVAAKSFSKVGHAGMLLALNATDGEPTIKAQIKPSDVEGVEGKLFAVRECFSGECRLLKKNEAWKFELGPYGVKLFSLVPVEKGAAAIGLTGKYVSPATVKDSFVSDAGIKVVLAEGGQFVAYSEKPVMYVGANGSECEFRQEDGWVTAEIPTEQDVHVWMEW